MTTSLNHCIQRIFLLLLTVVGALLLSSQEADALAAIPMNSKMRAIVVTGANQGQGYALCQRILQEYDDTFVFLCSRDMDKGIAAVEKLCALSDIINKDRVQAICLDVTDTASIKAAVNEIEKSLNGKKLYGFVSNAGILWGYSLQQQFQVNARGVCNVLDAFLPLMDTSDKGGSRMIVISSGLGPLMHSFASNENKQILNKDDLKWDNDIETLIQKCLQVQQDNKGPAGFDEIGFSGGPFAESVPDFHMYGLAKMFADAYMASLGKKMHNSNILINSCDPGLVYTELILKMPKYEGKSIQESGAQTPAQGVEAAMRLLFDKDVQGSGHFYAMNKAKDRLLKSTIDVKPAE